MRRGNKTVKLASAKEKTNDQPPESIETIEVNETDEIQEEVNEHESEPFSMSKLILHFVIILPMANFRPGPSMVYSILIAGRHMLYQPFTYVVPFFIGYLNIHLGGVYMATKLMSGPYEERAALASIIGRIVHFLARSKELEWVKETIKTRPDGYPTDSSNFNTITEWCIVIVLLAMPRGLSIVMFLCTLLFCSPTIKCGIHGCVPVLSVVDVTEITSGFLEDIISWLSVYGSISNQLNMLTAFICYCMSLALLLYLSRYTRISGDTLRDLLVVVLGGFGLLICNPIVGLMMALLCFMISNSEFYYAVLLGQDREKYVNMPVPSPKLPVPKYTQQNKPSEDKIRRIRPRNQTQVRQEGEQDKNEPNWEFLPWRVPVPDSKFAFVPNGKGGIQWHQLMGFLIALYFPIYESTLSHRLGFQKQKYEYATVLLTVAHPIVVSNNHRQA